MQDVSIVILCGGKGTRSFPFTEFFPKVMMPIDGTPIIVHLMKYFADQGFKRFILAAGYRQELLRDYFEGRFSDWDINVLDTGPESDTGERVFKCQDYVTDTFIATYGDGLGNVDLKALLDFHKKSGGLATLTSVPLRSQYGIVHYDADQKVKSFEEKPLLKDYYINAGFIAFDKKAFDNWEGTNMEVHVLPHLANIGELYTSHHDGFWRSMDTSKDQQDLERIITTHGPVWMSPAGQEVVKY